MSYAPAHARLNVDRVGRGPIESLLDCARAIEERKRAVDGEAVTVDRRALHAAGRRRKSAIVRVRVVNVSERSSSQSWAESDASDECFPESAAHEFAEAGTVMLLMIVAHIAVGHEAVRGIGAADEAAVDLIEAEWRRDQCRTCLGRRDRRRSRVARAGRRNQDRSGH